MKIIYKKPGDLSSVTKALFIPVEAEHLWEVQKEITTMEGLQEKQMHVRLFFLSLFCGKKKKNIFNGGYY